jgi:hypothetical protein
VLRLDGYRSNCWFIRWIKHEYEYEMAMAKRHAVKGSSGSNADKPKHDQAEKLFKAFGNARKLRDALECIGVYKQYSTVYRWGYAASRGGTDGIVPYKLLSAIGKAGANAHVRIPASLLKPAGLDDV